MTRQRLFAACLVLTVGAVCATQLRGQTTSDDDTLVTPASYHQRLAQLEAELAALKSGPDVVPCSSYTACDCEQGLTSGCCCNDGCGDSGLYTGAALVFAKPHFKEAFQTSVISVATLQQQLLPFLYDYSPSPRVWLGYKTPSGMGIRADYWQFDQAGDSRSLTSDGFTTIAAHATTIIFPATILADDPGDTLTATDGLQVNIANVLGTVHTEWAGVSLVGGGGLRYASLKQGLSSVVTDAGQMPVGQLTWVRIFEGMGPTVFVSARRPIGSCGLSFIAEGGGALLFGRKSLDRFVFGNVGPPTMPRLTLDDANEVVPIGDIRLGAEYAVEFACDWELALQGVYEGQLWAEAGAPTLGFLGFEGLSLQLELRH